MDFIQYAQHDAVADIILNRPEKRNAFDAEVIQQLIRALQTAIADPIVQVIVLSANGDHFCAGADLHWMRQMAEADQAKNKADALELAKLLDLLYRAPKPTIARVQGSVYGGGLGLVACCDVVIADISARFCFSEVKLGLIPAVISPYALAAIGARQAKRYFLTAELFDAKKAQEIGLVHEYMMDQASARQTVTGILQALKQGDAGAQLRTFTAELIAKQRTTEQARLRMNQFLEKTVAPK